MKEKNSEIYLILFVGKISVEIFGQEKGRMIDKYIEKLPSNLAKALPRLG